MENPPPPTDPIFALNLPLLLVYGWVMVGLWFPYGSLTSGLWLPCGGVMVGLWFRKYRPPEPQFE
eukprot:8735587-Heterocapsa_arctica.AAC.1